MIDARKFSLLVSALVCINAATAQQNSGPTAVGFPEGGHFIGSEIESVLLLDLLRLYKRIPDLDPV